MLWPSGLALAQAASGASRDEVLQSEQCQALGEARQARGHPEHRVWLGSTLTLHPGSTPVTVPRHSPVGVVVECHLHLAVSSAHMGLLSAGPLHQALVHLHETVPAHPRLVWCDSHYWKFVLFFFNLLISLHVNSLSFHFSTSSREPYFICVFLQHSGLGVECSWWRSRLEAGTWRKQNARYVSRRRQPGVCCVSRGSGSLVSAGGTGEGPEWFQGATGADLCVLSLLHPGWIVNVKGQAWALAVRLVYPGSYWYWAGRCGIYFGGKVGRGWMDWL